MVINNSHLIKNDFLISEDKLDTHPKPQKANPRGMWKQPNKVNPLH